MSLAALLSPELVPPARLGSGWEHAALLQDVSPAHQCLVSVAPGRRCTTPTPRGHCPGSHLYAGVRVQNRAPAFLLESFLFSWAKDSDRNSSGLVPSHAMPWAKPGVDVGSFRLLDVPVRKTRRLWGR